MTMQTWVCRAGPESVGARWCKPADCLHVRRAVKCRNNRYDGTEIDGVVSSLARRSFWLHTRAQDFWLHAPVCWLLSLRGASTALVFLNPHPPLTLSPWAVAHRRPPPSTRPLMRPARRLPRALPRPPLATPRRPTSSRHPKKSHARKHVAQIMRPSFGFGPQRFQSPAETCILWRARPRAAGPLLPGPRPHALPPPLTPASLLHSPAHRLRALPTAAP